MKTDVAVSYAIKNTAGVVASAALVMVAVFAIFGSLSFVMFKQMGVGLAFAVLLDATLIRGVLLPATMKLLGDRNWWLPKRLGWLPKIALEGEPAPARA
jgi:RND superfamily putative drug exporter